MKKSALTGWLLCLATCVCAAPARRIVRVVTQPDGTTVSVVKQGDEHFHFYTTTDGIALSRDAEGHFYYAQVDENGQVSATNILAHDEAYRSAADANFVMARDIQNSRLNQAANRAKSLYNAAVLTATSEVPQTGRPRIPIILIEYADVKFSEGDKAREGYTSRIATKGYSEGKIFGSIIDYFYSQSNGKFDPQFDIIGPVTLSQKRAYYGGNNSSGNDKDPEGMVSEACQLAKAQGLVPDYSIYDNDKDGEVDVIYTIYAGVGESSSDVAESVWPHQYWLKYSSGGCPTYDGVTLNKYACNNELYGNEIDGIGTFCHEFSHCLGLPDFYDTNYRYTGMYVWDLLDMGSYNGDGHIPCGYSAYERNFMGWMDIEELSEAATIELNPLNSDQGKAYRITNPSDPNEYFILENRQLTGWDSALCGHGMLVFHVTYDEDAWNRNIVNNYPLQRMTLLPADGYFLDNPASLPDTLSLAGDPYPGITKNAAINSFKVNTGSALKTSVTSIAETDTVINFQFMGGVLTTPYTSPATQITPTGFMANWEQAKQADAYTLLVKKISAATSLEGERDTVVVRTIRVEGNVGSYAVTDLDKDNVYIYAVKTHLGNNTSRYSAYTTVDLTATQLTTTQASARNAICPTEGGIAIATDEVSEACLYSADGLLRQRISLTPGINRIPCQKGIYLVRTGGQTAKVVVTE